MGAEWFRDTGWNERDRAEFERRLRRAKPWNRPQYLRIKGLSLQSAGDFRAAEALYQRVLAEHPDSLDAASALEHLADLARIEGRSEEAERHYRTLLALHPTLNATTGLAELSLAELLIERDPVQHEAEAWALLAAVPERNSGLVFHSSRFRWHLARAYLAAVMHDVDVQQESAQRALDLLEAGPPFARHPTVGLAEAGSASREWLRAAVAGPLPPDIGRIPPWRMG